MNDHAWWQGEWLRLDEILQRLPRHKFKTVWVQTSNSRQRYWVCKQRLRLRTLYQGSRVLTVVFSETSRDASEATYLISSHDWSARRIVRTYARRDHRNRPQTIKTSTWSDRLSDDPLVDH